MMQFSILLLKCQCDNYVDSGILTGFLIRCALFMWKRILNCYAAEFSAKVYGYQECLYVMYMEIKHTIMFTSKI